MSEKTEEALAILREARERYDPVATLGMFSGGNDSTVLIDVVQGELDHLCHINTGIGIEETREFVRKMAGYWGLPLIEEVTAESYEEMVLEYGFPGPFMHRKMYQRLKERPLRVVTRRFIAPRSGDHVLCVSGVRRHESDRRMYSGYTPINEDGRIVWVNPLWDWTTEDMMAYRRSFKELPRNPVSDLLHMSGECLCGAYAHPGELDEIALWFPETAKRIRDLEHRVETESPGKNCRWEKGPAPKQLPGQEAFEDMPMGLCTQCELKHAASEGG